MDPVTKEKLELAIRQLGLVTSTLNNALQYDLTLPSALTDELRSVGAQVLTLQARVDAVRNSKNLPQ